MLLCLLFYISCLSILSKALHVNFLIELKIVLYIILHIRNNTLLYELFLNFIWKLPFVFNLGFFPNVLIYFMFPSKSKSKTFLQYARINAYIRWEILCKFTSVSFSHMITITYYLNKMKNLDISQSWSNAQLKKTQPYQRCCISGMFNFIPKYHDRILDWIYIKTVHYNKTF